MTSFILAGSLVLSPLLVAATNFLNTDQILQNAGAENVDWYKANVPILDFPDTQIQNVYYYRWLTWKEHLSYTTPQYGYFSTEFMSPKSLGYGGPFGCINAAAGFHIAEGRWLRDQRPTQDIVNFWLAGPGTFPRPASAGGPATDDWAHAYSFWAASAAWQFFETTGDVDFVTSQLDNLISYYHGWDQQFDSNYNLYFQNPVWDASEFIAANWEVDPGNTYQGGKAYRPTLTAYQYGDAMAISKIAALAGNSAVSSQYASLASALQTGLQNYLWDSDAQFFKELGYGFTPGNLSSYREFWGFVPWQFNMPTDGSDSAAFQYLLDSDAFNTSYGPPTVEITSQWYKFQDGDCCHWDGPNWPFGTAQVLTAAQNLVNNYQNTGGFTKTDLYEMIQKYAVIQHKNGEPYVAEAHFPDQDAWQYDTPNHSEDYNHSTFIDNIIAGLIGLQTQSNSSLIVNPSVPSSIGYFCLENVAYHGHNITVIWDATGSHYNQGQGLQVFVDNQQVASRSTIGLLTVDVGSTIPQTIGTLVNIAGNNMNVGYLPQAYASFTSKYGGDAADHVNDGSIFRPQVPQNVRWTTYKSTNPTDWIAINFNRSQAFSSVGVYFYADGQGVALPTSYDLEYLDSNNDWTSVPGQSSSGTFALNSKVTISFPQIVTSQIRLSAPNNLNAGTGWGLSEFEVYADGVFVIENYHSQKLMGVQDMSLNSGAQIQQYDDDGTRDHLWRFAQAPGGWWTIQNLNSGLFLTVSASSTSLKAPLVQSSALPSGVDRDSQLWRMQDYQANGQYFLLNKHSGLLAAVADQSTANSADITQYSNNGTPDHLWLISPAVPSS